MEGGGDDYSTQFFPNKISYLTVGTPFKCEECGHTATSAKRLKVHMSVKHLNGRKGFTFCLTLNVNVFYMSKYK